MLGHAPGQGVWDRSPRREAAGKVLRSLLARVGGGRLLGSPPVDRLGERGHLFLYVLAYRWLSLLPATLAVFSAPAAPTPRTLLAAVVSYNLCITLFHRWLNNAVLRWPVLLGLDILLCGVAVAASGGTRSPYYLYVLSPLFGAGVFFRTRGGLVAAGATAAAYSVAVAVDSLAFAGLFDPVSASIQVAGFFLIGGLFSSFASLLEDQRANARLLEQVRTELVRKTRELQRTNRELRSLHSLAVALQSAAVDVHDVQGRVLLSLTEELGYPRAWMALVDHGDLSLTGWMMAARGEGLTEDVPPTLRLALREVLGPLAQALGAGAPQVVSGPAAFPPGSGLPVREGGRYVVVPLSVRDLPVGILLVEAPDGSPDDKQSLALLTSVGHQAALALWSTRMCVERAQRSAILEERNRIARDIHDTVSQCLFGTVCALESCLKLLPGEQGTVRERLEYVLRLTSKAMTEIRRLVFDMWIGGMTTGEFVAELQSFLQDLGKPDSLRVEIRVEGDLTELTPFTRKHLFRIAQEALANAVKHARASEVSVHLAASGQAVRLVVRDDGQGFDPQRVPRGMGLAGMRERAAAVGAALEVRTGPGQGTTVEVSVPRLACVSPPRFAS